MINEIEYPEFLVEYIKNQQLDDYVEDLQKVDVNGVIMNPIPVVAGKKFKKGETFTQNDLDHFHSTFASYLYIEELAKYGFVFNIVNGYIVYIESLTDTKNNIAIILIVDRDLRRKLKDILKSHELLKDSSDADFEEKYQSLLSIIRKLKTDYKVDSSMISFKNKSLEHHKNTPGCIYPFNYPDPLLPLVRIQMCCICFKAVTAVATIRKHTLDSHQEKSSYTPWFGQFYYRNYTPVLVPKKLLKYLNSQKTIDCLLASKKTARIHTDSEIDELYEKLIIPKKLFGTPKKVDLNSYNAELSWMAKDLPAGIIFSLNEIMLQLNYSWDHYVNSSFYHQKCMVFLSDIALMTDELKFLHQEWNQLDNSRKNFITEKWTQLSTKCLQYILLTNPIFDIEVLNQLKIKHVELDEQLILLQTEDLNPVAIISDRIFMGIFIFTFGFLKILCSSSTSSNRKAHLFDTKVDAAVYDFVKGSKSLKTFHSHLLFLFQKLTDFPVFEDSMTLETFQDIHRNMLLSNGFSSHQSFHTGSYYCMRFT